MSKPPGVEEQPLDLGDEFEPNPAIPGTYFWRPKHTPEEEVEIAAGSEELGRTQSLLRAIRDKLDLTQDEMAAILGITQSSVSKLESKNDPPMKILRRLVERRGGRLKLVVEMNGEDLEWPFL